MNGYNDQAHAALATLEEHCKISRPPSPHAREDATRWMFRAPSIWNFDRDIINCFLSMFMKHVAPTFTSFSNFKVDNGVTSEKILAMAAVGALFCSTNGSYSAAGAMCSDARRILFTRVCIDELSAIRLLLTGFTDFLWKSPAIGSPDMHHPDCKLSR